MAVFIVVTRVKSHFKNLNSRCHTRYGSGTRPLPGKENPADYYTKRFAAIHHTKVRPIYLYDKDQSPNTLQGCVEILAAPDKKKPPRAITPLTRLTNPLTRLTNLERLHNSRLRLPVAAAAMVRLVNRLSNKCTHNFKLNTLHVNTNLIVTFFA